jgi:hypothetical protein
MATNYKVLGQSNPAATTLTTLYTVPAATQTIISTITVANQAATAATYRIAVRVAAASIAAAQYLAYDVSLPANASDTLTLGVTVDATDIISVYASSADNVL